jgi:hypothetical protein
MWASESSTYSHTAHVLCDVIDTSTFFHTTCPLQMVGTRIVTFLTAVVTLSLHDFPGYFLEHPVSLA